MTQNIWKKLIIRLKNKKGENYKQQASTFSAIYKSLPDLVFCLDNYGRYTSCNHSYELFTGHSEAEIIGKSPDEVHKIDEEMAHFFVETDKKVLTEKAVLKMEEWVTYPDRSRRLMETIKAPLLLDGEVTGILGISRDITEHKAAEKAAYAASRAKSDFLARMSHEIRTPMNAIIGMAELALRAEELNDAREHILTVKQAGLNLLSIINDILDFSKIESGKFEILPGEYSFSSLGNDVISIIRMRVIDSQVRFAVNIDSSIPNALIGDEIRIRQALLNLLSNAVKYTEKGFVSLTVMGEQADEDTVNLVLEVVDSGIGIKQEDIPNLFGEYTQFDLEKNRGIEGAGLGLAITKRIVKAMGGEIGVYSEYGKGSVFSILLPQKIRSPGPLASVKNAKDVSVIVYERREIYANSIVLTVDNLGVNCSLVETDEDFHQKMETGEYTFVFISFALYNKNKDTIIKFGINTKIVVLTEFGETIPNFNLNILAMPAHSISIANILNGETDSFSYNENNELIVRFTAPDAKVLVVDDINTNLKVVEGLLLPYKMKVVLCKNGLEAIRALNFSQYDLVFMDHKMPELDGIETTKRIREQGKDDPYYLNVPIIALTANAVSGIKEMFIGNGFNDFLTKPIDTIMLNAVLEKWIPKAKKKGLLIGNMNVSAEKKHDKRKFPDIDGLDVDSGISISGGSEDIYLETLGMFYKDCLEKINYIGECLENGNIQLYVIHVHGLKSASANIGALELSEAAKALENAGAQGDMGYIERHNDVFVRELKLLLERINAVLVTFRRNKKESAEPVNSGLLKQELGKLKTALETLDANVINETSEALRNFVLSDRDDRLIKDISDNILLAEYDAAINLIKDFVKDGD